MGLAVFVAMMWLFWAILTVWWVISPKHFPLNPNMTRAWVLVYALAVWVVLLIILIVLLPNPTDSQAQGTMASTSDMVSFIASFGVVAGLIVWSLQAKKRHNPALLQDFIKKKQRLKSTQVETSQVLYNSTSPNTDFPAPNVQSTTTNSQTIPDTSLDNLDKFQDIEDALMGDSPIVRIDYRNEKGEQYFRSIKVTNVLYSDNKNCWYIKAIDVNKSATRTFRLDRIDSAECNGKFFYEQTKILRLLQELEGWI